MKRCDHIWRVPEMARFREMRDMEFNITCCKCGETMRYKGGYLARALEDNDQEKGTK
jgi:RNase P subunit RPR2